MTEHHDHAHEKTIALFGAGAGLGASVARRFGREGFRVALVARDTAALEERIAPLEAAGITAAGFPADLTDIAGIPPLVRSIEAKLGPIDVAIYAPMALDVSFVPAVQLDATKLEPLARLFLFAPIELAHALVPGLVTRGGAFVLVGGETAIRPKAGLSGIGPAGAGARNFVFTLNAELEAKGAYAGAVTIGALIERSAVHGAMTASGHPLHLPVISPDDIADEVWSLVTQRDRVEAILPAPATKS